MDNPFDSMGISREKAEAFLDRQAELAGLQAAELRDDLKLHHWRMRVEHTSSLLKLAFEITVALLAVAILAGAGTAIWKAAHDRALVIEAFSVPPDLAARGLDGKAVAAHLQDKLAAMQAATQSIRPADSYSNDWGNDIKVQIPETGVSIGEVQRLLVTWLGHQTHITGEVWNSDKGLAITTRVEGEGAVTVTGASVATLLEHSAESIYRRTQPYRYAVYLQYGAQPDWARVRAVFESELRDGSPREQAWAYIGLSNIDSNNGENARSLEELHKAAAVLPSFELPWQNMAGGESSMGHEEAALAHAAIAIRLLPSDREIAPELRAVQLPLMRGEVELLRNDYAAALREYSAALALPVPLLSTEATRERILLATALLHDARGVQAALKALPATDDPSAVTNRGAIELLARYALGDTATLIANYQGIVDALVKSAKASGTNEGGIESALDRQVLPYFAVAFAQHGDFAKADTLAARIPLDCDPGLRARGLIAAAEHRWAASQYWFEQAVHHAPSIALGYSEWGAMLLAKGDFDGAIAKFAAAYEKSPHFADPLELWGEALTRKNRSDLALAKFEAAAEITPNWGRLHLKWAEALTWSGHKAEAKTEAARAAALDLSAAEKRELARLRL